MIFNIILNKIKKAYKTKQFCRKATIGSNTVITHNASISAMPNSVRIGSYCHISGSIITQDKGKVTIGNNVFIGGASVVGAVEEIVIGDDAIISSNVHIYDNNNHPVDPEERREMTRSHQFHGSLWNWNHSISKPIVIHDNVWIGEYSSILKGVTVGEGSIIAAKSVVTKDVPDFCIVAGNPARVVKSLKT